MGIRHKLVFANVAGVLLSVLVIGISLVLIQTNNLKEQLKLLADVNVDKAATDIQKFFVKPETIINNTIEYVVRYEDESQEKIESYLESLSLTDSSFLSVYYAATTPYPEGGIFYNGPHWDAPLDYDQTTRDWFIAACDAKDVITTDPYVDAETGSVCTTLAKSIRDENGKVKYVVALDIYLDKITPFVEEIALTKSGKSFLIDSTGLYVTHDDSSKIMNVNFFDEYPEFKDYLSQIPDEGSFVSLKDEAGNYFAAEKVSDSTGWYFITIGPDAELFTTIYKSMKLALIFSIIALICSFALAVFISMGIVKPLTVVDSAVNDIANGSADLTKRISDTGSKDEVGSLVKGFNGFVGKLQNIISEIKGSKNTLSNVESNLQAKITDTSMCINEMLGNIDHIGTQVDNQAGAVQQTSAAVAEIAENINSLERMIERQSSGVTGASAAVEQMIGNISSVNNSVEKMADSFYKLQENASAGVTQQKSMAEQIADVERQSKSLHEANQAIANVASQTNLLAMNAAIEAAHAGEAGQGFSVVADEIRKLSETSSAQSKKIGSELKKIQSTIASVVSSSKTSTENFNRISDEINSTDQLVHQIHVAMEEQQEGSKQIVETLKVMNDSTAEVKIASREMSEGNALILDEVKNLQDSTDAIKDIMKEMKFSATHIEDTGGALAEISGNVKTSVSKIGEEIDKFKA